MPDLPRRKPLLPLRVRLQLRARSIWREQKPLLFLTLAEVLLAGGLLAWWLAPRPAAPPPPPLPVVAVPGDTIAVSTGPGIPLTREELLWLDDNPNEEVPETLYEDLIARPQLQNAATLEQLRDLPAGKVSVSNAALLFARRFHGELDVAQYETQLDDLARQLSLRLSGTMPPTERVQTLLNFVYLRDRFAATGESAWFDDLLRRGRGDDLTMAMLLLSLGQRLGFPLTAVRAPDGLWLRISVEGGERWFIDPATGVPTNEAGARGKFGVTEAVTRRGVLLDDVNAHGVVAECYARQAQERARQLRAVEALDLVNAGLGFDPAHPRLLLLQGELLSVAQPQAALPVLKELAERRDAPARAQYLYGRALRALGRPDEALPWLLKATATENDSAAWRERAACRRELNQCTEAVADYRQAALLMSGDMEVIRGYADALTEYGLELRRQQKLAEAEQAFTQALALYGRDARALFGRARTRINRNDRAGAVADLKAVLRLDPNHSEARQLLARFER